LLCRFVYHLIRFRIASSVGKPASVVWNIIVLFHQIWLPPHYYCLALPLSPFILLLCFIRYYADSLCCFSYFLISTYKIWKLFLHVSKYPYNLSVSCLQAWDINFFEVTDQLRFITHFEPSILVDAPTLL
jgi:hypothetical protein